MFKVFIHFVKRGLACLLCLCGICQAGVFPVGLLRARELLGLAGQEMQSGPRVDTTMAKGRAFSSHGLPDRMPFRLGGGSLLYKSLGAGRFMLVRGDDMRLRDQVPAGCYDSYMRGFVEQAHAAYQRSIFLGQALRTVDGVASMAPYTETIAHDGVDDRPARSAARASQIMPKLAARVVESIRSGGIIYFSGRPVRFASGISGASLLICNELLNLGDQGRERFTAGRGLDLVQGFPDVRAQLDQQIGQQVGQLIPTAQVRLEHGAVLVDVSLYFLPDGGSADDAQVIELPDVVLVGIAQALMGDALRVAMLSGVSTQAEPLHVEGDGASHLAIEQGEAGELGVDHSDRHSPDVGMPVVPGSGIRPIVGIDEAVRPVEPNPVFSSRYYDGRGAEISIPRRAMPISDADLSELLGGHVSEVDGSGPGLPVPEVSILSAPHGSWTDSARRAGRSGRDFVTKHPVLTGAASVAALLALYVSGTEACRTRTMQVVENVRTVVVGAPAEHSVQSAVVPNQTVISWKVLFEQESKAYRAVQLVLFGKKDDPGYQAAWQQFITPYLQLSCVRSKRGAELQACIKEHLNVLRACVQAARVLMYCEKQAQLGCEPLLYDSVKRENARKAVTSFLTHFEPALAQRLKGE